MRVRTLTFARWLGNLTLNPTLKDVGKAAGKTLAFGSRDTLGASVDSSLFKMASLLQSERVLYLVQGEKKVRAPLSQLYFCRYCSELRSLECVSHEVTVIP